ncbi:MAG: hypothetical protein ACTSSG_08070 [Candidatus Heimdallarchaeaceae archaeon]
MQPCPMYREIDNVTYCTINDELEMILPIKFYDPDEIKNVDITEFINESFCLNAVIADENDLICCPTKQQKILIRDREIPRKIYINTREVLLFMDPDARECSECLYKAFVAMIKSVDSL